MGDGTLIRLGEVLGCDPPDIDAVRWEEAAIAAAEGSRELGSLRDFPSWIVLGTCVGELFLGVEPRKSFLENVRVRLLPVFSGAACVIGGEAMDASWLYSSGLVVEG